MRLLTTARLHLRDYEEDDWRRVHEYASDAEVCRYMEWGPNSADDTREFIRSTVESRRASPRRQYAFALTLRSDGTLIGGCGLDIHPHAQGVIGYCLHPGFWGQGYAAEAARALCGVGLRTLGLHRIFATCRPENLASARVMEKVGMTREGLLREHLHYKGQWQSSYLYSILADEYRNLAEEYQESEE